MQKYEDKEGINRTALNIVQRMYFLRFTHPYVKSKLLANALN